MSKKKKILIILLAAVLIVGTAALTVAVKNGAKTIGTPVSDETDPLPKVQKTIPDINTGFISVDFRASGDYFYRLKNSKWNIAYLKGVNMGLTEATTSLSDPNVSYDTYTQWFQQIADMNANTVKVFTVMNPNFYKAFYDYNRTHDTPLYLLQGIWFNENHLYDIGDAYGENNLIIDSFKKAVTETLDIVHGKSDYTDYGSFAPAVYEYDISEYVAGYILGLEWPADFILNTNANNPGKVYRGEYMYTGSGASPFEAFLCEIGNHLIAYETRTYMHQTPVAFLNWSTTDALTHTNEPFEEEDSAQLNVENIQWTDKYFPGQFAAMDIYPYYPEFINYQEEYTAFKDPTGKTNPYRAYLRDLKAHCSMPFLVAEVGLSTSRGVSHNSVMGYKQGGLTEEQQGKYVCEMLGDITRERFAGAMIFSWQDEWFKQVWNTVKYAPDDPQSRTPNVQIPEQSYGILAMEAGKTAVCKIDGEDREWSSGDVITQNSAYTLSSKYDAAYLYLKIDTEKSFDFDKDKIYIPIQTAARGSDSAKEFDLRFNAAADFLIQINGQKNSRVFTDAYNDSFHYIYAVQKGVFPAEESYAVQNSGVFNTINTFTSNELYLPVSKKTIEAQYYESGLLHFGISDPDSKDYDSLADFCEKDGVIEVRVPWYLLGIVNSAEMVSIDDFYENGTIRFSKISGLKLGIGAPGEEIALKASGYEGIPAVEFHTRLKKSYDIIRSYWNKFMEF